MSHGLSSQLWNLHSRAYVHGQVEPKLTVFATSGKSKDTSSRSATATMFQRLGFATARTITHIGIIVSRMVSFSTSIATSLRSWKSSWRIRFRRGGKYRTSTDPLSVSYLAHDGALPPVKSQPTTIQQSRSLYAYTTIRNYPHSSPANSGSTSSGSGN